MSLLFPLVSVRSWSRFINPGQAHIFPSGWNIFMSLFQFTPPLKFTSRSVLTHSCSQIQTICQSLQQQSVSTENTGFDRGCITKTGYRTQRWRLFEANKSCSPGAYAKRVSSFWVHFRGMRPSHWICAVVLIPSCLWPSRAALTDHSEQTWLFRALEKFYRD